MSEITPFDKEEKELFESIEQDEWQETKKMDHFQKQAKNFADSTLRKDKRMNIRIAERDLNNLKIRALQEGLPYQTLVSMILHKYITGQLKEN